MLSLYELNYKNKDMKKYISFFAIAIILCSCGTINKISKKNEPRIEQTPVVIAPITILSDSDTAEVVEGKSVLASDIINGEWTISKVYGQKLEGEERPYITFADNEGRFYGSNGCNIINGSYELAKGDTIVLSNIITTQKYCQDAPYEYKINGALNNVQTLKIEQKGNEFYLNLLDKNKISVLELRKHNMNFLDGMWQVILINGNRCDDPKVKLAIDINELRLHGNTGCNIINASLYIDPDKTNSLQFEGLMSSRMACDKPQQESDLKVALEMAESCVRGENKTAIIYDKDGNQVLVLQKIK